MSLRARMTAVSLAGAVLLVALYLLTAHFPAPQAPPAGPGSDSLERGQETSAAGSASEAPPRAARRTVEGHIRPPSSLAPRRGAAGGWTIAGRVVRDTSSGTAAGEGSPRVSGQTSAPVEGAVVSMGPHPRRTRPGQEFPPERVVTGADGRFEVTGVPAGCYVRLDFDEPGSALLTYSFRLRDPEPGARIDMGDLPLVPGGNVQVKIVGPHDEPVSGASILVKRDRQNPDRSSYLDGIGVRESRREAVEGRRGEYLLERAPVGLLYLTARAPGYAPSDRIQVEVPNEEPVVVRLEAGSRISGRVFAANGSPLAGAEVEADGPGDAHRGRADAAGRFVFAAIGEGEFDLSATAEGFLEVKKKGVPAGSEDLELVLEAESVFAGRVTAGGKAVFGATVVLRAGSASFKSETDGEGSFAVRKLPAGSYAVSCEHRDFAPLSLEDMREIQAGEHVTGQTLAMVRGLSVRGRVVRSDGGEGVSGALVVFEEAPGGQEAMKRSGRSESSGAFRVGGLRPGEHLLSASAPGHFSPAPQAVSVEAGEEGELTVVLERGALLTGRVLDQAGEPVAGAEVRLLARPAAVDGEPVAVSSGSQAAASARSGPSGEYRLEGLAPGEAYLLAATHRSHSPGWREVALEAGQALGGIDLFLGVGGSIRGRVVDEGGLGIAGATVWASSERPHHRLRGVREAEALEGGLIASIAAPPSVRSSAEGSFLLEHLIPGAYSVSAQASDRLGASATGVAVAEGRAGREVVLSLGAGQTFQGTVLDEESNPVTGVEVRLADKAARSDEEGRFVLRGLVAGPGKTLVLSKRGFETQSVLVEVPGLEGVYVLQRSAAVSGSVSAPRGELLTGLRLTAVGLGPDGSPQSSRGYSIREAGGKFEVSLPAGTYFLVASAEGFAPARSPDFTVRPGERLEGMAIALEPGSSIEGVVVARGSGEPVAGAQVSALRSPQDPGAIPWSPPSTRSTADGAFVLSGLPEGPLSLHVRHPQHAPVVQQVMLKRGQTARVRLDLPLGGVVRGTITLEGRPAARVTVLLDRVEMLEESPRGVERRTARSDSQGRFELTGLTPGEYHLSAHPSASRSPRGGLAREETTHGPHAGETLFLQEGQVAEVHLRY